MNSNYYGVHTCSITSSYIVSLSLCFLPALATSDLASLQAKSWRSTDCPV